MAKYEITYSCGCEGSVKLYGPGRERERKIEWYEGQKCYNCLNKEAAKKNEEDLPELTGTEKQIAWAEALRRNRLDLVDKSVNGAFPSLELYAFWGADDHHRIPTMEIDDPNVEYAVSLLKSQTSAQFWIETREIKIGRVLAELYVDKPLSEDNPENKIAEDSAKEESLITPESPVSGTPAEISCSGKKVSIHYPIKNRDFWEIVKPGLGYAWSGSCWQKKIGVTDGSVTDRIAEAGHRLLAAGFPVIIYDAEARGLAVSGEYTPRHTRWISKITKTGKFGIEWDRREDYYTEAKKITSAQWEKPYITVLPSEFEEVLDFAELYDFQLTPGAMEIINEQRAIRAAGSVVHVEPVKDEVGQKPGMPELCPDDAEQEIDSDLRDD